MKSPTVRAAGETRSAHFHCDSHGAFWEKHLSAKQTPAYAVVPFREGNELVQQLTNHKVGQYLKGMLYGVSASSSRPMLPLPGQRESIRPLRCGTIDSH